MRHLATTLLTAVSLSLAVGCATDPGAPAGHSGGGGGKADGEGTWEDVGKLTETTAEEQEYMHTADAECLHINHLEHDPYYQSVKLFCLPRGGVAAPLQLFVGVVPMGEAGGAYKVYSLPGYVSDVPKNVDFHNADVVDHDTVNGTLFFDAAGPLDENGTGAVSGYRVEVRLQGDQEDPTVDTWLSTMAY